MKKITIHLVSGNNREKLKGMSMEEIFNFGYKHVSDKINTEEYVRKMEQEKEKFKTTSSRMIKNDFLMIGTLESDK